jgi:hypothetical protein
MGEKVSKAVEYMNGAYSCSQSVLCAFCDDAKISHDDAKKIAAPYSGGRAVKCGALYAGELVLKSKYGENAKLVDELDKKFQEKVGAINCRDIRSKNLRPCVGCVEDSATILSKIIAAN